MRHFAFIPLVFLVLSTHAQITSTFDVDADGWTLSDNNNSDPQTVNYFSTGGNPGGYVSATKTSSSQPYFWTSPSKFGGNIAYFCYGQELSFDLQVNHIATVHGAAGDVQIKTPSGSILALNLATFPAQAPAWSNFTVRLDETAGWRVGSIGGPVATKAQMIQYLSGLSSFRINIKYNSGVTTFTGAIDNIILNQRTVPSSPSISSISVTSGNPGTSITINGTNFDPSPVNNVVYFGGAPGTITNATATSLTVTIPNGAQYGQLMVINKNTGLSKLTEQPFTPTFNDGGRIIPASFSPKFDISITGGYGGVSIADMDGDGWNDLVVARDDNTGIWIYRNLGSGGTLSLSSFDTPVSFPTLLSGTNGSGLKVIDFDNDGMLDMVTSGWTGGPGVFATFRNTSTPGTLSFEAVEYWSGRSDESPVYNAADIDGDGLPELISGEGSGGAGQNVWITQNMSTPGNIEFGYSILYFSATLDDAPSSATIRDLNNDGKPEFILVRSFGGIFTVFTNTSTPGSISFGTNFSITEGIGGGINVADFNGDGKNDLAWKSGFSNDDVHIRLNTDTDGLLTDTDFATEIILDSEVSTYGSLSIADINGDNKPDILATDNADVGIFENVFSGGAFSSNAFVPGYRFQGSGVSTYPATAQAADLNGDNKPDIVVGITNTSPDRLSIYENKNIHTPVISLTTVSPLKGGMGSTVTITGDYFSTIPSENMVHFGSVQATVLTATKTQLTVTVPAGASYAPVRVTRDQFTASYHLPFNPTFSAGVTFDNTHFAAPVSFTLTGGDYDIDISDLNGDGKPDILAEANTNKVYAFRNTHTSGAISTSSLLADDSITVSTAQNPRIIDVNGDNKPDFIATNGVFRNLSSGSEINFEAQTNIGGDVTAAPADFNHDGKIEYVGTVGGSFVRLFENHMRQGTGAFISGGNYNSMSASFDFAKPAVGGGPVAADFDNDGLTDMACGNGATDNMTVWKNNGDYRISTTSFTSVGNLTTLDNPGRLYSGDLDVDGKVDIVLYYGIGTASTQISVFHNTSSVGTLSFNRVDYTIPAAGTLAWISDLDGDGRPEILVTSETTNQFFILKNTSSPGVMDASSFATPFPTAVPSPRGLATGDINLDGKPEIIINTNANTLLVFENLVPTSCIPPSERAALIALYNATDGANWTDNTNWLSGDESSWAGVSTTGCNVTGLFFQNNNLNGSLPVELGDLTELTTLSITLNPNLTGNIPVTLGNLSNLTTLQLWNNSLTGPIPTTLGNLNNLQTLELRNNQLSGNLPSTLGNIATLEHLELDGNLLTGTIPASFFGLTNLKTLELGANQLIGSISPSIAGLSNLESLGLSGNQLSGTLPTELGSLIKLTRLQLAVNQFTGNLPASIGNLISLTSFSVFNNQLTGTVPSSLSNLVNLTGLGLSVNQFTGDVPAGIGLIPNLSDVSVRDNDFTSIPTFVSTSFTDLLVYGNKLHFGHLEPNISKTGFVYSPQDNLPGGTLSVCEGSTLTINFSTPGTANQYQWYKDGSPITGANSSNFSKTNATVSDAGNYTVQVTNTIVTGLTLTSDVFNVSIEQAPCSNQPPVIASTASGAQIEGIVIIDLLSLISDPDGNLDLSTLGVLGSTSEQGASASINSSSELVLDYSGVLFTGIDHVTIEVCDLSGVCVQQELTIDVAGDVIIYNAISPNSDDNLNNIFTIQYIEVFPGTEKNRVTIYNRWGDVVWEGIDYDNSSVVFDGTSTDGKELPSGTYFYKIEYTGGRTAKTGYLSLKK